MKAKEPRQTRFDLRFCLGGMLIRIHPLFWAASAILGIRYYADPEGGGPGYFGFWMVAVLVSGVLHGLGQGLMGRFFGMRGSVALYGLGSLTLGIEDLPRSWQRLLILVTGPLVQILIVAGIWGITWIPFPDVFHTRGWATEIATGAMILVWINLYWALLNLLPIWPLDGGRMAQEIGCALLGKMGGVGSLLLSILVCGFVGLWIILQMNRLAEFPYSPRYFLDQQRFSTWLLFVFVFWLRSFQGLWPEPQDPIPTAGGEKDSK